MFGELTDEELVNLNRPISSTCIASGERREIRVYSYDDGNSGFIGLSVMGESRRGQRRKRAAIELTIDEARRLIAELQRRLGE